MDDKTINNSVGEPNGITTDYEKSKHEKISNEKVTHEKINDLLSFSKEEVSLNPKELITADAQVLSINISETKGVVKEPVFEGQFVEHVGLKGDAHAGDWHRMVSLLAIESYEAMKKQGTGELAIGSFAENLTTKGVVLHKLPVGTQLSIGETIHEVTQIGKQCHTGCAIRNLVGDCVMPREGIFTRIIKGGTIKPGDSIQLLSNEDN